jgi:hypothetical protein
MLDMLGEDARAAVGKVKSLQSQGATPEQIDAQMIEAARNGLLPISVAFAAQKALKRQNPPAPPSQGTVLGDMMQQLSMRQQGIAGLENPVMDNAEFAGGGVVAFAPGGSTAYSRYRKMLEARRRAEREKSGVGSLTEDAADAAPLAADVVEEAAPLGRMAKLRVMAGRAGKFLTGKGPIGTAVGLGLLGLPMLFGDDEEKKAAAAAKTPEVALRPSSEFGQQPGAPGGIAELMATAGGGPNIGGYQQAVERAMAQYGGETDPSKAPTLEDELKKRLALEAQYGIGEASKKQQDRIDARRVKAEEEGSKSFLTELGLSFLTKGVMAAGEGKDTMSAMAFAVEDGAKSYKERKERVNSIIDKLDDAQSALDAQQEAAASGRITLAQGTVDRKNAEIRENRQAALGLKLDLIKTQLQLSDSAANRQLSAALEVFKVNATNKDQDIFNNLWNRYEAYKTKGTKAEQDAALAEVVKYTTSRNAAYQAVDAKLDAEQQQLASITGGGKAGEGGGDGYGEMTIR